MREVLFVKKVIVSLLVFFAVLTISLAPAYAISSDNFSQDTNAINKVVKSVLKLEVLDSKGNTIATGSGFVAFSNHYLITNYHVVEKAASIVAISDDEKKYVPNYVACADKNMDIAILGFNDPIDLDPLNLHADKNLLRGSEVIAIGSPIGIKNTVSSGIISAVYEENGVPWIQITAPISPGSSGGAVFNDHGEVIGVSSASYIKGQNLNLAINIGEAIAMYQGWDGVSVGFKQLPKKAVFDYTGVYPTEEESTLAAFDHVEWICPNCGNKNNTAFCLQCGTAKPLWKCVCGALGVSPFCGSCGKSLDGINTTIEEIETYRDEKQYEKAADLLKQLGSFDSFEVQMCAGNHYNAKNELQKTYYLCVDQFLSAKQYEEAVSLLQQMAGSDESSAEINLAYEKWTRILIDDGQYEEALTVLDLMEKSEYQEKASFEVYKKWVQDLVDNGLYDDAVAVKNQLSEEKDKRMLQKTIDYLIGMRHYDAGEYLDAAKSFAKSGNYEDAAEWSKKCYYMAAADCVEQGEYQTAANYYQKAKDYEDAAEKKSMSYYMYACALQDEGKYEEAIDNFENAEGYEDAEQKRKDLILYTAESYRLSCEFDKAIKLYSFIKSEEGVSDLYDAVVIEAGDKLLGSITAESTEYDYIKIIDYYDKAYNKERAKDKKTAAIQGLIEFYIAHDKLDDAIKKYNQFLVEKDGILYKISDPVICSVGYKGNVIGAVLNVAVGANKIRNVPKNETEYKEQYKDGIMKLEQEFGLTADGEITLSEYDVIVTALYPRVTSDNIRLCLERLCDLGYIASLPEKHSTYDKKYMSAVKKYEHDNGMKTDGILVGDEVKKLMAQIPAACARPKGLKVSLSGKNIKVSWDKVNGASLYEVRMLRFTSDDTLYGHPYTLVGVTEKNTFTIQNMDFGDFQNVNIVLYATNYYRLSDTIDIVDIFQLPRYSEYSITKTGETLYWGSME